MNKKFRLLSKIKSISVPQLLGGLFFLFIFLFGIIYSKCPSAVSGVSNFWDALYFSIVTITTLGFGDLFPTNDWGRFLVCLEAIVGIIFVGLFLNAVSKSQADKIDRQEKDRIKQEKRGAAKSKLRQYYLLLKSIMERYLISAYTVITPIEKRNIPEDIFHHHFQFSFNDMRDLYKPSLVLFNPLMKPAIVVFFEEQDKLYIELRRMISDIDISYWESMEKSIHSFFKACNEFAYKGSVLECVQAPVNYYNAEVYSKAIKEHVGEVKMMPSDAINQFVALYFMMQENVICVQQIAEEMQLDSDILEC